MRSRTRIRFIRGQLGVLTSLLLVSGGTSSSSWAATATAISRCPFAIITAGNYIVPKDLTSVGTCISIGTISVSIDLQGHTLTGNGTGEGIVAQGGAIPPSGTHIVISNGTIEKFGEGILANSVAGPANGAMTIIGMTIQKNGGNGLDLFGGDTVVGSKVVDNGGSGITIIGEFPSAIISSQVSGNGGTGIAAESGPVFVIDTVADNNVMDGIALALGGVPEAGNRVVGSHAKGNGGDGIDLGNLPGAVIASTAVGNAGAGIVVTCPSEVAGSTAGKNGSGNLVETPGSAPCTDVDNTAP
jgi:hypothetical protein